MIRSDSNRHARLRHFETADMFNILMSRGAPIEEVDLLRILTGEKRMPSGRERLFELHFSLYHALYRLKFEAGAGGYYLHLDPMRIRLIPMPGPGSCHHYYPETGSHCDLDARGAFYCGLHQDPGTTAGLSFDPLLDFYSNPDNISYGTSAILDKLMKGVIIYAIRRGEVERALNVFGISRPTMKSIKKKYHELAKAYHPDLNSGDDSLMKELNHSYQILTEVYVL
jgi:hypothetical protein